MQRNYEEILNMLGNNNNSYNSNNYKDNYNQSYNNNASMNEQEINKRLEAEFWSTDMGKQLLEEDKALRDKYFFEFNKFKNYKLNPQSIESNEKIEQLTSKVSEMQAYIEKMHNVMAAQNKWGNEEVSL